MFKTVLVGYDGSPQAAGAIALARALCDHDGAVEIATVAPVGGVVTRGGAYDRALEDRGRALLAAAVEDLGPGVPVAVALLRGSPARALTERAEATGADLVVLGETHRGAAGRIAIGTTAQRLLHGAPCAVAVAPEHQGAAGLCHVGVAYDGSAEADAALDGAYAIAAERGAAVTIYTVVEHPDATGIGAPGYGYAYGLAALDTAGIERAQRLVAAAAGRAPAGVAVETVLLTGRPGRMIADAATGDVDVMLVGSRGYGPLRRALLGSVSADLVAHAGFPVIVVPRGAVDADRILAPADAATIA